MIGLVDCNNFFVSCERVFRPELIGKPVLVLSNNDGCAAALSNEAKALGYKRGDAYFKVRDEAERHGVIAFSGNHRLYGDMSRRVMTVLRYIARDVEVYSVDEGFIHLPPDVLDYSHYGRYVARTVRHDTGIPVSVGIAPTKTLAKIASRFAKKWPGYRGACVIDTEEKRRKALSMTAEDVWGIGRAHRARLAAMGVTTALQLPTSTKSASGVCSPSWACAPGWSSTPCRQCPGRSVRRGRPSPRRAALPATSTAPTSCARPWPRW